MPTDWKKYNQSLPGKWREYRRNARTRGITWMLTKAQFESHWGEPCFWCGEEFEGFGIDRYDSDIGYEDGNTFSCCSMCNFMKRNYKVSDWLKKMVRILELHRGEIDES